MLLNTGFFVQYFESFSLLLFIFLCNSRTYFIFEICTAYAMFFDLRKRSTGALL